MTDTSASKKQPLQGSKGGNASTMAELMAKQKAPVVTLTKGESVKGTLTKLTKNEIAVDIGAKTEALVLEKDKRIHRSVMAMFKVGDTVEVNILNPESESGQPVVSLRRYLGNLAWSKLEELLKSKETIEVTVSESSKAGLMVATDFGIAGFLPNSHTTFGSQQDGAIGQRINVSVLELNRPDNKVIFSQKTVLSEEDFAAVAKQYKVGDTVKVTVSNVTPFGLFVTLPFTKARPKKTSSSTDIGRESEKKAVSIEGFIHISEIAWEKVTDLASLYSAGTEIEAVITRFDSETRRVNLSVKRLTADPFEALVEKYLVDKKVSGVVTSVDDTGVTLDLGDGAEGLIKKEKIAPGTTYTVDQKVTVTVSEHDKRRHRIIVAPVLLEKPLGYR